VKLTDLPKGVSVASGELDFAEGIDSQFVTLTADESAKPIKDSVANIYATSGKYTANASLRVTVQENLENRAARKKAYSAKVQARLDKVKQHLDEVQRQVKENKNEEEQSTMLKKAAESYESLDRARKSFEKLQATPVELWEREVNDVDSNVANAEASASALLAEAKARRQE
jgi:hypothetical protein